MTIDVRIWNETYKVTFEGAQHPKEYAVLVKLNDPEGEPKHFTLLDKEIFKSRDKETVMKDIIEPTINRLTMRVPHRKWSEQEALEYLKTHKVENEHV
jgi:hypothetical protein